MMSIRKSFAIFASSSRAEQFVCCLRVILCVLIAAHGWARMLFGGVAPFGDWLNLQGFPGGIFIAISVTAIEILGTPLLALGLLTRLLSTLYIIIYSCGLFLVHAPEGWFVVGLGRNGMEYSVLLIVCLFGILYQSKPRQSSKNI